MPGARGFPRAAALVACAALFVLRGVGGQAGLRA